MKADLLKGTSLGTLVNAIQLVGEKSGTNENRSLIKNWHKGKHKIEAKKRRTAGLSDENIWVDQPVSVSTNEEDKNNDETECPVLKYFPKIRRMRNG